jgi:hypothetical protein
MGKELEVEDEIQPAGKSTKFPWKELIVMYMVVMSDSIALTSIGPFVPGVRIR